MAVHDCFKTAYQFSKSGSCCFAFLCAVRRPDPAASSPKSRFLILGNGHTHGAAGFHFDARVISGTPHSGATVDDEDFDGSGRTSEQRNKQQGHALETGNKTGMRNLMRSEIERKCITDESRYKQEGHN